MGRFTSPLCFILKNVFSIGLYTASIRMLSPKQLLEGNLGLFERFDDRGMCDFLSYILLINRFSFEFSGLDIFLLTDTSGFEKKHKTTRRR